MKPAAKNCDTAIALGKGQYKQCSFLKRQGNFCDLHAGLWKEANPGLVGGLRRLFGRA